MTAPQCSRCGANSIKNGKSKNGAQRYYCKPCRKHFQLCYSYNACSRHINQHITSLLKEGCGIRGIARVLQIAVSTVISRIRSIYRKIRRPFPIIRGREYEIDEIRTYVGSTRNLCWVVYALCKLSGNVVDFRVGPRTRKTLRSVVETTLLSDATKIWTDRLELYKSLIPQHTHNISRNATNRIERKNLNIRTHLKRLSRRTICFSRSRFMLECCIGIYFWESNTKLALFAGKDQRATSTC
jgi:insertion element IS1 protein InsB